MKLRCPCGERIVGIDDDDLVERTYAHLRDEHPHLVETYTRDNILAFASR